MDEVSVGITLPLTVAFLARERTAAVNERPRNVGNRYFAATKKERATTGSPFLISPPPPFSCFVVVHRRRRRHST